MRAGWLWAVMDHARNNYGLHYRDALSGTLNFVTGNSFLTAYLLLAGVCAAIAVDGYFAYVALPKLPETKMPAVPASWPDLNSAWRFLRARNQFAYAAARYQRETGVAKARAATIAAGVDAVLANVWFAQSAAAPHSRPAPQLSRQ